MEAASQREERMRKIRGATTSLKDAAEGKGGAVGKVGDCCLSYLCSSDTHRPS